MLQAPETLITQRLMLRRPRLTDAVAIFEEYCQDPAVTKYLIWRPHKDIQETIDFLTGALARWAQGRDPARARGKWSAAPDRHLRESSRGSAAVAGGGRGGRVPSTER